MRRHHCYLQLTLLAAALLALPARPALAQSTDSYLDAGAADLLRRARGFKDSADSSILSYTGTVRSRMNASLRMPLKDRTLLRSERTTRVRWSRTGPKIRQVIAAREQTPKGVSSAVDAAGGNSDELFDPTEDRIYFGLTDEKREDDDIWIEHPLAPGAEQFYRYQSGDTARIRLQDGRILRSIELRVIPRVASGHVVAGSLWIDPDVGAVVQAVYRLARTMDLAEVIDAEDMKFIPPMLKPLEFDLTLVAVEYALYDLRYWMPRFTRIEGFARAGVVRTPGTYEISYEIDEVITATPEALAAESARADSVIAAWAPGHDVSHNIFAPDARSNQYTLIPVDTASLRTSDELPEPIGDDSPSFATEDELEDMYHRVAQIPRGADMTPEFSFTWGYGRSDLLRYNRVESLSIGARAQSSFIQLADVTLHATGRIGIADLHPNLALGIERGGRGRYVALELKHALAMVDTRSDAFGLGNSASALLFGRDAGEYYRTTGVSFTVRPPEAQQQTYELSLFAQYDNDVKRETQLSLARLWESRPFRSNIVAAETGLAGATLHYRPWWGTNPRGAQLGVDWMIEGVTGGYEFARSSLTLRTALPLPLANRLGIEVGGGTIEGDAPPQRIWYVGGAHSLRGYEPSTLRGTSFARARAEFAHTFGWGGFALFSDAAWAGDRDAYDDAGILYSAGAGFSLLDGTLRFDLAHALRDVSKVFPGAAPQSRWRLELYLDAIL